MARAEGNGILLIDIETLPIVGETWGMYEQSILRQLAPTAIACASAKWLGGKQVTFALPDFPGYVSGSRDDKALCLALRDLLDEADIVVAHNGISFDIKKINARMIANGIPRYSPVRVIDTLRQARAIAAFDANKLGYLGEFLGCGQKLHTGGFSLWGRCLEGDEKAWKKMKRYNAQDVRLLEAVFLKLRPWMKNIPSTSGECECSRCGSRRIQFRGLARNQRGVYRRFQCQNCGGWDRSANAEKPAIKPYVAC